jgi:nucleoside-diphosphate-sugar epimerase
MKVIIAGATGFVGQEVLSQCLAHPSITSIVALCRCELPITHAKLHVHRMKDEDFLSYSDPQLSASLQSVDACIWTLGITPSRASDEQAFRQVTLDYASQAAKAFNNAFTASNKAGQEASASPKFRFVYVSGGMAERDQSKPLWFNAGYRRVRV